MRCSLLRTILAVVATSPLVPVGAERVPGASPQDPRRFEGSDLGTSPGSSGPSAAAPVAMRPVSLSAGPVGDLQLLLTTPVDDQDGRGRWRLVHLLHRDRRWSVASTVDGFGIFKPAASVATPDGRVHLFWAGVRGEERQSPTTHLATDLYHCLVTPGVGSGCSAPRSLHRRSSPDAIELEEAVVDRVGSVHLVFVDRFRMHHLLLRQGGAAAIEPIDGGAYPRLHRVGEALHLVYVDAPTGTRGANDLFHRVYEGGAWSPPRVVFSEARRDVHAPALAIDDAGVQHLVFYALVDDGPRVEVLYASSGDDGETWSTPEALFSSDRFFAESPTLAVRGGGVVHLAFSYRGELPWVDNYTATFRDGAWSPPRALAPGDRSRTKARMVVGGGVVHLVWGGERAIYQARLEADGRTAGIEAVAPRREGSDPALP